jgi:hypothetical protein
LTGAQIERWMRAEQAPVDPAVFRTVQLIYIARPGFGPGLHDPVPQRSGTWQGEDDVVAVPALLPEPEVHYETDAAAFGPVEGLDELCAALRSRLEGEFHVREHILQAARAYVRQHGANIDQAKLTEALEAVARERRNRAEVAGYGVDRIVDHVVRKERASPPEIFVPAPQETLPPYFGTEGANAWLVTQDQHRFVREWLRRNLGIAVARRKFGARRDAALAAETVHPTAHLDFNEPTPEEQAAARRLKLSITKRLKREVLDECGLEELPTEGERTLVTGAQGTGKSTAAAKETAEMPRGEVTIWWTVPTLEKADEQAAAYRRVAEPASMVCTVVRGRAAADPRSPGETMCPRHEVVNRAATMGVNVPEEICKTCPMLGTCGFQAQARELSDVDSGLFLMASDYLWLACPAPYPDILIVDESVLNKATDDVDFEPSRIVADDLWAGGDLEGAMERRRVASLVRDAITKHAGQELAFLRDAGIAREDLGACRDHLFAKEENKPYVRGWMPDKQIERELDAVEAREIQKVLALVRQIHAEIDLPRDGLNSIWFDPEARVKVNKEIERQPRVFVSRVRKPLIRPETPVLALDGTGSLEINRKLFGEYMTRERFAAPRDAEVIQVSGRKFARQSLTGCDGNGRPISAQKVAEAEQLRAQLIEFLKMLPGRVLLVTYLQAEELLKPHLPPHAATAHFNAVRGLNSFEKFETAVVVGRLQPSPQDLERETRPFTATDARPFLPVGEYVTQPRGRRMRDAEAPNVVAVEVHADTRCQAVLEQIREAEIVQAVDRVRPVFNRRRLFLLCNLALDVTVDRVIPWQALKPGKFAHAFARHGVLPLSAGDLSRAFPDLWATVKEAENAVAYATKNTLKSPNNNSIWRIQGIFRDLFQASYRRQGQRGRLAKALISAELPDARAALQSLVGELVEFHVERPHEAAAPQVQATLAAITAVARGEGRATLAVVGGSAGGVVQAPVPAPTPPPRPPIPPQPLPPLPPLAAALSAESHLLATGDPMERPVDALGLAGVMKMLRPAPQAQQPLPRRAVA